MPHLDLGNDQPGIGGLLRYRPQTAGPLRELAQVLLCGDSALSRGERELIAAYVSRLNECDYCANSHGACAAALLPGGAEQVEQVLAGGSTAPVTPKLGALLHIANLVQRSGKLVTADDVTRARVEGATDLEIHDTVLIAAAFSLFNRYVDGLGATTPADPAAYTAMAIDLVREGYRRAPEATTET